MTEHLTAAEYNELAKKQKRSFSPGPEARLQMAAIAEIDLRWPKGKRSFQVHSHPNERRASHLYGGMLKRMGLQEGIADLEFVRPSGEMDEVGCAYIPTFAALYVELKAPPNKQTDNQKAFQADCDRLGIPYVVASSVEEVLNAMHKHLGVKL